MQLLKVGHLVLFTVAKAWPEASACLVWIEPEGPFGLLPRAEAVQPYKVGDTGFAAVGALLAPYPRLTQGSIHYLRRMAEMTLSPLRAEGRLAVTRVAYRPGWPWAKVLVRLAAPEVMREATTLIAQAAAQLPCKLILIPKEEDLERQIRAALYPARPEAIVAIRMNGTPRSLVLEVDPLARGLVIGPRGLNLRAAELLVKRRLAVAGAERPAESNTHYKRVAAAQAVAETHHEGGSR